MVVGDIYNIEARVREIDPRLVILFDYFKERYVVYEKVRRVRPEAVMADGTQIYALVDELMHVITLENEDGGFRPLDSRLIDDLIRMDTHRDEFDFKKFQENARKQREKAKEEKFDGIRQMAKYYAPLVRRELKYGL
jgi:hypothetical protein